MNDHRDLDDLQRDDSPHEAAPKLIWHPAIRALGWVKDWCLFALSLAMTWELFASGTMGSDSIGRITAMAPAIAVALAMLIVVVFVVEVWGSLAQHARRNYPARFAIGLIYFYSVVAVAFIGPYLLLLGWVLKLLSGPFARLGHVVEATLTSLFSDTREFQAISRWKVSVWLAYLVFFSAVLLVILLHRLLLSKCRYAHQLYGTWKFFRGMGLMMMLRCRQPRKDFFVQAPIVGQMHWFALAAVLHAIMPPPFFSWAVPLVVVVSVFANAINYLIPPAWFFLGRSQHESFLTFDKLYHGWRVFGVTMLDRDSRAWHDYYFALANQLAQSGHRFAHLMNRPRTPRVWSFRSRDAIWELTAMQLMKYVKVVVIDVRSESFYIFNEVHWLAELRLVHKTWYVGEDDGSDNGLTGALAWGRDEGLSIDTATTDQMRARVITEKQLCDSKWDDAGLKIAVRE